MGSCPQISSSISQQSEAAVSEKEGKLLTQFLLKKESVLLSLQLSTEK